MTPFIEGMLAGYGIAIPVGAIAVLIINSSITCGFKTGFMAGAGAATADLLYAALAGIAGVALSNFISPLADAFGVIGGIVLIALAVNGFRHGLRGFDEPANAAVDCRAGRTYLKFVGLTLINPLTVVYFSALILGGEAARGLGSPSAILTFVLGAGMASFSWQSLLAGLGGLAGARLSERARLYAAIVGSLIVFVLGLRLLFTAL
jgi:threonine/homoserine/homoserine lactone efflux protein